MNRNYNFPKLIIKNNDELEQTININPLRAFFITDTNKYIVIYNIIYTNNKEETIHSFIPYYLSDGQTNNFRAGMLLPFICINDKNQSLCPYSESYPDNTLFKYNIIQNINMLLVRRSIHEKIHSAFFESAGMFLSNLYAFKHMGVMSVLPRLENLLDFFIAICSDRIIQEVGTYPIKQYRPYYNKEHPDPYNYELYSEAGYGENIHFMDEYDTYRKEILEFLNKCYKNFSKFCIFENEFINMELTTISKNEFNNLDLVRICSDHEIDVSKIDNISNYVLISKKLHEMMCPIMTIHENREDFFNKYNYVPESKRDRFINDYSNFITFFNKIYNYKKKPNINVNVPYLENQMKIWDAKCQRKGGYYDKYMKYKNKYINLKNNI